MWKRSPHADGIRDCDADERCNQYGGSSFLRLCFLMVPIVVIFSKLLHTRIHSTTNEEPRRERIRYCFYHITQRIHIAIIIAVVVGRNACRVGYELLVKWLEYWILLYFHEAMYGLQIVVSQQFLYFILERNRTEDGNIRRNGWHTHTHKHSPRWSR